MDKYRLVVSTVNDEELEEVQLIKEFDHKPSKKECIHAVAVYQREILGNSYKWINTTDLLTGKKVRRVITKRYFIRVTGWNLYDPDNNDVKWVKDKKTRRLMPEPVEQPEQLSLFDDDLNSICY